MTYYLFTSFTTVGLGDYYPVNNTERIVVAFILFFGVMLTSVIMENFSQMIKQIKDFNRGYENSDDLNLFFGTLKRVNHDN